MTAKTMTAKPFLMGSETEYSVSMTPTDRRRRRPPEALAELLISAVRQEFRCLQDATFHDGVFLENGGRLYNDIHGHPEYCTPECQSPEQIAAYDKAGERILRRLAKRLKDHNSIDITVTKNNLTSILPDTASFGNHESYLCWVDLHRAAQALIPHLVTRLPYAGAGCLSAHPQGWGFELSQRARHLVRDIGPETTGDRAIFCTRVRKSTDSSSSGWTRCHLIAKDSQRAPLGIYLTFGTTGLLFWIMNHGGTVGQGLKLANPVQALRNISLDPWLRTRVPLADGRSLTALEIQQTYLDECEAFTARHELPEWGPDVMRHWRDVLQGLGRNPLDYATRLDSYAKLLILQHEVQRSGFECYEVREALQRVDELRRIAPHESLVRALIEDSPRGVPDELRGVYEQMGAVLNAAGPRALDQLRFVLRLQVLDLKYHELGGIYDQMAETGRFDSVVLESVDIDRAVVEAPPGGRAAVRGGLVKTYSGQPHWCADWSFVQQCHTGQSIDLSNPFATEALCLTDPTTTEQPSSEPPARSWEMLSRLFPF